MSLEKTDKIIAIIGVIILIGAGIGIYLYWVSDEETEEPMDGGEMTNFFNINYEPKSSTVEDYKKHSIRPKLIGKSTKNIEVTVSQQNIKSITFVVDYVDNKKGLVLGFPPKIGADTLAVTVRDGDGNIIDSQKTIKGNTKKNATIYAEIGSQISLEPIEAETEDDALYILENRYVDYQETYTVTVTLKVGLWGKFRELLGQDSFGLEITCEYYDYTLEPQEKENNPGDDDDNQTTGGNTGTGIYTSTNFPLTKL